MKKPIFIGSVINLQKNRLYRTVHTPSGSIFSLDIFGFPSFLYVHETCSYHCSFLEGHSIYWNTYLSCTHHIRGVIPPRTTFHLFFTHETLNWDLEWLFAPPQIIQHSRTKPKAQYIILGLYPYNAHNGEFPLSTVFFHDL